MKEKIIELLNSLKGKILQFLKKQLKSWKFWLAIVLGIICAFGMASTVEGLQCVPYFFGGFILGMFLLYFWIWCIKIFFKFWAKLFKGAGKATVAVAKGAGKAALAVGAVAGKEILEEGKYMMGLSDVNIPSPSFKSGSSEKKKDVRKVWQMQYVGKGRPEHQGLVVQVPSRQQSGGPAPKELLEAIQDLGFDDAVAHALWNGMSSSDWKVLS